MCVSPADGTWQRRCRPRRTPRGRPNRPHLLDEHLSTRRWLVGPGRHRGHLGLGLCASRRRRHAPSSDWPMVRTWCGRMGEKRFPVSSTTSRRTARTRSRGRVDRSMTEAGRDGAIVGSWVTAKKVRVGYAERRFRSPGCMNSPPVSAAATRSRFRAATFTTSPLYQRLCPAIAEDDFLLGLLERRQPGQDPPFLLFGAVHYLLLSGVAHHLRRYYASIRRHPSVPGRAQSPRSRTSASSTRPSCGPSSPSSSFRPTW